MEEKLKLLGEHIHSQIQNEYPNNTFTYTFVNHISTYSLDFIRENKKNETEIYVTILAISFSKNNNSCVMYQDYSVKKTVNRHNRVFFGGYEEYLKNSAEYWVPIYQLMLKHITEFLENDTTFRLQKLTKNDFFQDMIRNRLPKQKEEASDTIGNIASS